MLQHLHSMHCQRYVFTAAIITGVNCRQEGWPALKKIVSLLYITLHVTTNILHKLKKFFSQMYLSVHSQSRTPALLTGLSCDWSLSLPDRNHSNY